MARKENASYEKSGQRRSLSIDEALKRIAELETQLSSIGNEITAIKQDITNAEGDISSIENSLSSKANTNAPTIINPTLRFLLGSLQRKVEFRRSGGTGEDLSLVYTNESGTNVFNTLIDEDGDFRLVTKTDYPGYAELWSGSATTGNKITVPNVTSYDTYAIVASFYPMALFGVRWGSKILAFGIDVNSNYAFRVASIMLEVGSNNAVTVTKSKVADMTFNSNNGASSNFVITNIYGVT